MFRNRQQFAVLHATDDGGASGAQQNVGGAQGGDGGEGTGDGAGNGAGDGGNEPGDDGRTVNRYKHEREVKALNDQIASLKAELEKSKGTEDEAAKVRVELDALKAELADEKLGAKLAAAGCINPKAAKALLDDYEGDVAKLAEACPYLFKTEEAPKVGATGGNAAPGGTKNAIDERISSVFKKR